MSSITLSNVAVHFPIFSTSSRSLKKNVIRLGSGGRIAQDSNNRVIVEALNNISLNIVEGDRVGLIGHNGAGKTTLLRVMAGVFEPTRGHCYCEGKVTPLFDATLGMDMEATGHENILLRGLFMGLNMDLIRRKTDEIAEFTELGNYLSMPVRTYSSGMIMRLAFGISTCVDPEILVMDEWFSIGDIHFVERAERRMLQLIDRSRILVMASHSPQLVRRLCTKLVLLDHGEIVAAGDPDEVLSVYAGLGTAIAGNLEVRTPPLINIDGNFVEIDGAIKYIKHGRMRHVGVPDDYLSYNWTKGIIKIEAGSPLLVNLKRGPNVPRKFNIEEWIEGNPTIDLEMRQLMVSVASGKGIEIGAGARPLRMPIDCQITYVDVSDATLETKQAGLVGERTMMEVDVKDSFERLDTFPENSQDFIAASHVIERLANPVAAIVASYKRLVVGGYLFIVVADKRFTLDADRQETTTEHLLEDFYSPSRERDFQHFLEYHQKVTHAADYMALATREFEANGEIRYHVWTIGTFYKLIQALRRDEIAPFAEVWCRSKVSEATATDFYFALRK